MVHVNTTYHNTHTCRVNTGTTNDGQHVYSNETAARANSVDHAFIYVVAVMQDHGYLHREEEEEHLKSLVTATLVSSSSWQTSWTAWRTACGTRSTSSRWRATAQRQRQSSRYSHTKQTLCRTIKCKEEEGL